MVLREKMLILNKYIAQEVRLKIINLSYHLNMQEKKFIKLNPNEGGREDKDMNRISGRESKCIVDILKANN